MKYGPLWFPVVPHKDREFPHNLEVGTFPSDFIFPSLPGPFLRADEDLGCTREIIYLLKNKILEFTCVLFQVQDNGSYCLGLDDPQMLLNSVSYPFYRGLHCV